MGHKKGKKNKRSPGKKLPLSEPVHPKGKDVKNIDQNEATNFKVTSKEQFSGISAEKRDEQEQPKNSNEPSTSIKDGNETVSTATKANIVEKSRIQKNNNQIDTNESHDLKKTSATNSEQVSQNTISPFSKQVATYAGAVGSSGKPSIQVNQNINSIETGNRRVAQNVKPPLSKIPICQKSLRYPPQKNNPEDSVSKSPAGKKSVCEPNDEFESEASQIKGQDVEVTDKGPPADCEINITVVAAEGKSSLAKDSSLTNKNTGKGRGKQKAKAKKRRKSGEKCGDASKNYSKARGIQWSNNSCYFDSTIFAMFYKNEYLDPWFLYPSNNTTNSSSEDKITSSVQEKLDKIVKSMRNEIVCPSRLVQDLRNFLSQFNPRLVHVMLDVEEMLLTLCNSALKMDPFIEYTVGSKNFYHQIFFLNDYQDLRTVQELLKISMEFQKLTFASMPAPALFLKMPRSNGVLEHCKFIVPNLELDLHGIFQKGNNLDVLMDLRAVICLSHKHYTVYVRDIASKSWCYFDDLGPSIVEVNGIEEQIRQLTASGLKNMKSLQNSPLKELTTGAHFCIYFPQK